MEGKAELRRRGTGETENVSLQKWHPGVNWRPSATRVMFIPAQVLAQKRRQHGVRALHQVGGGGAAGGFFVERGALLDKIADVGNVDTNLQVAVGERLAGQRIIKVPARLRRALR